jgi:large conductance mechanosensitive channel
MLREFKEFALRGNVLDLAVGVIMGAAFGKIITSLVDDIIMPPVGRLLGGADFSQLALDIGVGAQVRYGAFLNAVLAFIIVAFVVWQIGRTFVKEAPPPEVKPCPFCLEPNAAAARKCRACTSSI